MISGDVSPKLYGLSGRCRVKFANVLYIDVKIKDAVRILRLTCKKK